MTAITMDQIRPAPTTGSFLRKQFLDAKNRRWRAHCPRPITLTGMAVGLGATFISGSGGQFLALGVVLAVVIPALYRGLGKIAQYQPNDISNWHIGGAKATCGTPGGGWKVAMGRMIHALPQCYKAVRQKTGKGGAQVK